MFPTDKLRWLSLTSVFVAFVSSIVIYPEAWHSFSTLAPTVSTQPVIHQLAHKTTLPLVIWHGLGDSYDATGLQETVDVVKSLYPNTYVKVIQLGDTGSADRQETFFGNVTEQLQRVCTDLAEDEILKSAPAINALGFSQGGQFLRGYVERCNTPPVHNLVTFGGQHNGISEFESCSSATDFACQAANALLKLGTWTPTVQSRLVPAQYYRDSDDLSSYLSYSNFLADINNERKHKNRHYADNIARLNRFVMYMFSDDTTVVPKESSWFGDYNKTSQKATPLELRPIYQEDWLGLRMLAEKGGIVYDLLQGEHMQFSQEALTTVVKSYFGPVQLNLDRHLFDNHPDDRNQKDALLLHPDEEKHDL